jgi:hypothetical protein
MAALFIGIAAVATGPAFTETIATETKDVMIDGEVVRYEPGQVIVIRGADSKEVVYSLSPTAVVPAEVAVGRRVTLYTERGLDGGTQLVSRVVTTAVLPDGKVQRTTEESRTLPSGAKTRTVTTKTSGTVEAYEAGKTLTITKSDGSKVTYVINEKSKIPADLVIGKTVSIVPTTVVGSDEPVAQTITYVTTTTTKTTKTVPAN